MKFVSKWLYVESDPRSVNQLIMKKNSMKPKANIAYTLGLVVVAAISSLVTVIVTQNSHVATERVGRVTVGWQRNGAGQEKPDIRSGFSSGINSGYF